MTRDKCLAVLFFLSSQLCWGQSSPSPKALTPEVVEMTLSGAKQLGDTVKQSTTTLLQQERGVSAEVRRGVNRVVKACAEAAAKGPLTKLDAPPAKASVYLNAKQTLLDELVQQNTKKSRDALTRAEALKATHCTGLSLLIKSKSCQAAQALLEDAREVDTAQKQQLSAIQDRYKYFSEAANKESEGCVKPGFTDKLLKANEEHLLPQEQAAIARLGELQRQVDVLLQQMESP